MKIRIELCDMEIRQAIDAYVVKHGTGHITVNDISISCHRLNDEISFSAIVQVDQQSAKPELSNKPETIVNDR